TMIMVTPRVSEIVPGFTHGLLIGHGRILASGPLDEVLTDELYSRTMEIPVHLVRYNERWQVQVK
ncbi:MAG: ABC transporter ATP-binding protein, partial [Deltaproteobacteria bacterium]|nr:ABC transporter ATP-binding protein [Deltaproteobacteria bacterium]